MNEQVELWYQQNLIVFARGRQAEAVEEILRREPSPPMWDLMHPGMYRRWEYRRHHGIPEQPDELA